MFCLQRFTRRFDLCRLTCVRRHQETNATNANAYVAAALKPDPLPTQSIPTKEAIDSIQCSYIIDGPLAFTSHLHKTVTEPTIVIRNIGDLHPEHTATMVLNCETLVLEQCNKNFVYYWFHKRIFPNVRKVFMLSHPCETSVFHRWYSDTSEGHVVPTIYLAEWYGVYKRRWVEDMENVIVIGEDEIKQVSNKVGNKELNV